MASAVSGLKLLAVRGSLRGVWSDLLTVILQATRYEVLLSTKMYMIALCCVTGQITLSKVYESYHIGTKHLIPST